MSFRSLVVGSSPHRSSLAHSKRDELQRKMSMFCCFSNDLVRNSRLRELLEATGAVVKRSRMDVATV